MSMPLQGKNTLVVGSGRGTGRAIAEELASQGAWVIVTSRTRQDCEDVAREINARSGKATAIAADVSNSASARGMVAEAIDVMGHIDILVFNAALERQRSFLKISDDDWDQMLDTNLKGFFACAQAAAADMVAKKTAGKIIAIASTAGTAAFPNNADYCASKGGMIALVKAMAIDLGRKGITTNAIAPGFIQSDQVEREMAAAGSKIMETIRNFIPVKRFAAKEEIARTVAFLASAGVGYMNGSVLTIDGGLTLGNLPTPS